MITLPLIKPALQVPKTVAVVGSSPKVLDKKAGPEIDKFPCILRFNRAPHTGWEEHVGSRTDVRYTSRRVFRCRPHEKYPKLDQYFVKRVKNTHIVAPWPWSGEKQAWAESCVDPSNSIHLVDLGKLTKKTASVDGVGLAHPTAGHAVLALLISAGIRVHVFGFSLDMTMGHYWEPRSTNQSLYHKVDKERGIWKAWAKSKKIILH